MNIAELELDAVAEAIEEAGYTVGALRIRQVLREFEKLTLELTTRTADHEADKRSLNWCGEQLAACAEFLKEGETVAECIARNRRDADAMLGALAKERMRVEELERENANLRAQLAEAQRDAERFLWMTADHDNADVRERVVNLCNRLPMMSTSAVRMYIDAAMQEGKP